MATAAHRVAGKGGFNRHAWNRAVMENRTLRAAEKHLALVLGIYANADGVCWPSYERLGRDLSRRRQNVHRTAQELAGLGVIELGVHEKGSTLFILRDPTTWLPSSERPPSSSETERCHHPGPGTVIIQAPRVSSIRPTNYPGELSREREEVSPLREARSAPRQLSLTNDPATDSRDSQRSGVNGTHPRRVTLRVVDDDESEEVSAPTAGYERWRSLLKRSTNPVAVVAAMVREEFPRQFRSWQEAGVNPYSALGRLRVRGNASFPSWEAALKAIWKAIADEPDEDLVSYVQARYGREQQQKQAIARPQLHAPGE